MGFIDPVLFDWAGKGRIKQSQMEANEARPLRKRISGVSVMVGHTVDACLRNPR